MILNRQGAEQQRMPFSLEIKKNAAEIPKRSKSLLKNGELALHFICLAYLLNTILVVLHLSLFLSYTLDSTAETLREQYRHILLFSFSSAKRAMDPKRVFSIVIHSLHLQ